MTVPSRNTQIVAQGLARLTGAFITQPNVRAMLAVYLKPWQDIEDATWGVLLGRFLATATLYPWPQTNPVLDTIGQLVGQPRAGLADSDYRSTIYLRVAVNRATGRTTDWSTFAAILLRTCTGPVSYIDAMGQGSFFFGVWNLVLNPNLIGSILAQAVGLGVYGLFAYSTWPDGNDVECCDVNNVSTTGQGTLGDSVAGLVGGVLVSGLAI